MNKKRLIISYIISIALVICLSASILLCVVNTNLLNVLNVKKKLAENNYYESVYNIINDSYNNYIMQSGFDNTVLEGVFSKEDVEKDVNGIVDYIYTGNEYIIQTDALRLKLDENIQKFIEENNYAVSEENQKSIEEFEKTIEDTYKKNIEYSHESIGTISGYTDKARKSIRAIIILTFIMLAVLTYVVHKLNKPAVGISLLSTGALCIFLKCYSGVNVAVNNILIFNKAFSNVLISTVNNILQTLFTFGIILCIAGCFWILWFELTKKIKKMLLLEEHSQVIR